MADSIAKSITFTASMGGAALPSAPLTSALTPVGADLASQTQSIGTAWELVNIPAEISGDRHLLIKSLEAVGGNYVELAVDNAGTKYVTDILLAGDVLMRCPRGDIYARANTAAVAIFTKACEV